MVTARSAFALMLIATFVLSFAYFFVIPALETEATRPAVFEENPIIALGTNQTPVLAYNMSPLIYDDFNYNGTANPAKWTIAGGLWATNGTHLLANNTALSFLISTAPTETAGIAGVRILFRNTQIFYLNTGTVDIFSFGLLKDMTFEFLAGFTVMNNGTLYADIYASYVRTYHTEIADLANQSINTFDLTYYNNGTIIFKKGATTLTASDPSYINPSAQAYLMLIDDGISGCRLFFDDICNFSQPFPVIYSYAISQAIIATASDAHFNRTWVASSTFLPHRDNWYGFFNSESKNIVRCRLQYFPPTIHWILDNDSALLRFQVNIPQDSLIQQANLSVYCTGKYSGLTIVVQRLGYTNTNAFSDTHLWDSQAVSELSYHFTHQATFNAVNGWNVINIKQIVEDFIQLPYYVKGNWLGLRIMPAVNATYILNSPKIYIASSDSGSNAPLLKANYKIPDYQSYILSLTTNFQKAAFVNITSIAFNSELLQMQVHAKINLDANFDCQVNYTLFETQSTGLYNLSFKNYNTLALKRISYNQNHGGLEYHNLFNMSHSNANKYYFNYLLFDCITNTTLNIDLRYLFFENIVLNIGNNSVSASLTQLDSDLHSYFYTQSSGLYFHFNTSYNAFSRLNFTLTMPEPLHYTYISLTAKATIPSICYLAFYTDNPLDSWNTMPLPVLFNVGSVGVGRASFYYQQSDNCTQLIVQCTSNALYQNQTATGYIIDLVFTTRTEITQAMVNMPNLILALIILIVPGGLAVKFIGKGAFAPLLLVSDVACLYLGLLQWWVGIPVAVIALFIIFEGRN